MYTHVSKCKNDKIKNQKTFERMDCPFRWMVVMVSRNIDMSELVKLYTLNICSLLYLSYSLHIQGIVSGAW
jgi:hypothetical protein